MPPVVVDLVLSALILGIAYALASEGLWGAALMFFNILFAGLIAFNFYEPLAVIVAENLKFLSGFADTLSLMGLFIVALVILRLTTESLAPMMVRFPTPVYHIGRILFGLAGGAVTMAIVLLAFETAPVHKKVFGVVDYKYAPPFDRGLDREWLAFFQYTTGQVFAQYGQGRVDPFSEYGISGTTRNPVNVFDPRAEWLLRHQEARPYGDESILADGAGGGAAGAAAPGGAQPGMPPGP